MNSKTLAKHLRTFKSQNKLDFAFAISDRYGDCTSCVSYALTDKYGDDCMGVFGKHWNNGMNGSGSLEKEKGIYFGHWLNETIGDNFIEYFTSVGYDVEPKTYDENKCFFVQETDKLKIVY